MAKNSFNIADLYNKVWGITGVRFAIPDARQLNSLAQTAAATGMYVAGQAINKQLRKLNTNQQPDLYDVETIDLPASNIKSVLGTPIFEQILLTVPKLEIKGREVSPRKEYLMPDWPLFDITGHMIIRKTPVAGTRKGTVKELISEDDSYITIRGFLINYDSQEYPEKQLQELMAVINAKRAIEIQSQVFNLLDIYRIVIEDYHFPAVEGYQNMQPFELQCVSDQIEELEIKSVKTKRPILPG